MCRIVAADFGNVKASMFCTEVFRLAHVWEEFFDIASADAQVMVEAFHRYAQMCKGMEVDG